MDNMDRLNDDQKIMIYEWIKKGLLELAERSLSVHAYRLMISDMQGARSFDPDRIINEAHERTIGHIFHCEKYIGIVDQRIAALVKKSEKSKTKSKEKKRKKSEQDDEQ